MPAGGLRRTERSCSVHLMPGVKGFKRWIALGLAALVVLLLVAALVFRVDILRTSLDPKVPFQAYKPPRAPNYADARSWALPIPAGPATTGAADVFFIHPTTYNGGDNWNGPYRDPRARKLLDQVFLPNYAGPFARVGRVFAPRYRQASLYSHLTQREDARAARQFAYGDINTAFRYWRAHYDSGRPFVLVGVEQGGLLAARLLSEEIARDADLRGRVAGVYLIETVAPAADYAPGQAFPACTARGQPGCVLAWASPRDGNAERMLKRALWWNERGDLVSLRGRPALCVNPLSGTRSDAFMPARANRGAVNATGMEWGLRPGFMQRQISARCVGGVLEVSKPKSEAFKAPRGWTAQLRAPPYNLFYLDIENDALVRVSATIAREGAKK